MSQISEQIAGLNHQLKSEEQIARIGGLVKKLSMNADFKELILELYFESEAARLVHMLADPALRAEDKVNTLQSMNGISEFRMWLITRVKLGDTAEAAIGAIKEQLEQLAFEDTE